MGFPRQEYWGGLPFPTVGYLPDHRIEPMSLAPPELAGGFFTTVLPGKPSISLQKSNPKELRLDNKSLTPTVKLTRSPGTKLVCLSAIELLLLSYFSRVRLCVTP